MKNQNFKILISIFFLAGGILFNQTLQARAEEILPPDNISSTPKVDTPVLEETTSTIPTVTTPTSTSETDTTTPTQADENPTLTIIDDGTLQSAAQKIANFLKTQQSEDGKIIDGTITDWSIISFGAINKYADEIKNTSSSLLDFEKQYNLDDPSDLNSCATYPRHILALVAAGVNVNDNTIQGLKNKIFTICYKNNQYGLNGINDDIFGLIGLLAINTNPNEPIIQDTVSTILSWQLENGAFSWPDWFDVNKKVAGDDITGAAINALNYAKNNGISIDENTIKKAAAYLKTTQQADGGWGYGQSDPMTTEWVLMGINSLGEGQNEWFNSVGKNPWNPLIEQLKNNGTYESIWAPGTVDWFAMKHAIPAILGKSWPVVLPEKIQHLEVTENITYTSSGSSGYYFAHPTTTDTSTTATTSTVATTTLMVNTVSTTPTTTIDFTTTTLEDIIPTTTLVATNTTATIKNKTTSKKISTNDVTTLKKEIEKTIVPTTLSQSQAPGDNKAEDIINELPLDTSHKNNAKKMLAISGGSTIALGFYLGLRLLKNVV